MLPLNLEIQTCCHSCEHVDIFLAHVTLLVDLDPGLERAELSLQAKSMITISTVVLQFIQTIFYCLASPVQYL